MMKKNILIVDDNKIFAKSLRDMILMHFSDEIDTIEIAYNGNICLEIVKNRTIDIVFMDYNMPGINGAECVKKITQNNRYVKVVGVSFHSDMNVIGEMICSGSLGFISKDEITPEILANYFNDQQVSLNYSLLDALN